MSEVVYAEGGQYVSLNVVQQATSENEAQNITVEPGYYYLFTYTVQKPPTDASQAQQALNQAFSKLIDHGLTPIYWKFTSNQLIIEAKAQGAYEVQIVLAIILVVAFILSIYAIVVLIQSVAKGTEQAISNVPQTLFSPTGAVSFGIILLSVVAAAGLGFYLLSRPSVQRGAEYSAGLARRGVEYVGGRVREAID